MPRISLQTNRLGDTFEWHAIVQSVPILLVTECPGMPVAPFASSYSERWLSEMLFPHWWATWVGKRGPNSPPHFPEMQSIAAYFSQWPCFAVPLNIWLQSVSHSSGQLLWLYYLEPLTYLGEKAQKAGGKKMAGSGAGPLNHPLVSLRGCSVSYSWTHLYMHRKCLEEHGGQLAAVILFLR